MRLGVGLAAVATDFWLTVSLLSECCDWGVKALTHLGTAEGTHDELVLQCGVGLALTYVRGMTQEARSALTKALVLSEALGDFNHRFRSLYGLWLFALRVVDFRECLALARKYELLAEAIGDPAASATADWMLGMSRYYTRRACRRCGQPPAGARLLSDGDAKRRPGPVRCGSAGQRP